MPYILSDHASLLETLEYIHSPKMLGIIYLMSNDQYNKMHYGFSFFETC